VAAIGTNGAGIGNGGGGSSGGSIITISGGTVIAFSGDNTDELDIGEADGTPPKFQNDPIVFASTIKDGYINNGTILCTTNEVDIELNPNTVTLNVDYFTIPVTSPLTIPPGWTLSIPNGNKITNNGTITITKDSTLTNNGTIENGGKIVIKDNGTINGSGTITGNPPINNKAPDTPSTIVELYAGAGSGGGGCSTGMPAFALLALVMLAAKARGKK
jgi:hypothetical protein